MEAETLKMWPPPAPGSNWTLLFGAFWMVRCGLFVIQVRMTSRPTWPRNGWWCPGPLFEKGRGHHHPFSRLWRRPRLQILTKTSQICQLYGKLFKNWIKPLHLPNSITFLFFGRFSHFLPRTLYWHGKVWNHKKLCLLETPFNTFMIKSNK